MTPLGKPGTSVNCPPPANVPEQEFYQAWAQRYVRRVHQTPSEPVRSVDGRQAVAAKLGQALRGVSAQAWQKTEYLIGKEVVRHQINPDYVDPWSISQDVYRVYEAALHSYGVGTAAERFAVNWAQHLGEIRDRYTAQDPRVIAFVSMQFHYTGQLLLGHTHRQQTRDLELYFKAIDDHLYMPLQRAYNAAAVYSYTAPELESIRRLMPASSEIAHKIVNQVLTAFPNHHSHSGPLASSLVKLSSVRDVEMFQTYLWVCLLEGKATVVQHELFPLCVMLYPVLNVRWELVRYMLMLLEHEIGRRLEPAQWRQFKPYLDTLRVMFSTAVFPNQLCLA